MALDFSGCTIRASLEATVAYTETGSFVIKDKRDGYREAGATGGPRRVENPLSTESQEE
jgi:hypothetical protein